jgi:phosphate transport system substrate-binding protein
MPYHRALGANGISESTYRRTSERSTVNVKRSFRWKLLAIGLALCLGIVLAGCATTGSSASGDSGGSGSNEMATSITGAGATFPQPVYEKIFQKAQQSNSIQVNYQPVGSSSGIEQFTQGTVDFGASDAPMTDSQVKDVNGNVFHVATFGGAAVAAYNLKGVKDLNLTGTVLADIFMGKVKKWNDPAIAKLNPGVDLPSAKIVTVHRSDGSGTTNMFTGYLDAISPAWKNQIGYGTEVNWPSGIGGDGNDGVAGQIKQNPNSMGYVGLEYAEGQGIPYANIGQDSGGPYIKASVATAKAALEQGKIPSDLRVTVSTQAPFKGDAYPAVNYTFLLVQKKMDDLPTCKAVAATAWYITHQGQKLGPSLNYVELPQSVVKKDEQEIKSMKAKGQRCYSG